MDAKQLLKQLDFGSSVAEHDRLLESYFVETETFRALIEDRADVIAGDKGTGKSALYRILSNRYTQIPELRNVEVVSAFNAAGSPIFQRLNEGPIRSEAQYIGIWKAYILALAGNWILQLAEGDYTDDMVRLDSILKGAQLRSPDDTATGVFSRIVNRLRRKKSVSAAEGEISITPEGLPIVAGRLEFGDIADEENPNFVRHEDALRLLDVVLSGAGITLWLAIDRLDEAFQGSPDLERPVLRALFRTYLDMQEFAHTKLKLFVRRDLFRRIISGGFVNLSHVNARKMEIVWDEADLMSLLHKRVRLSPAFMTNAGLSMTDDADRVFYRIFPDKVDVGDRKPTTWVWMLGRIRDGNHVRPPRNLIDLALKAREAQIRREDREPAMPYSGSPLARQHNARRELISPEAIKRGLDALSAQRVEDTLLAEAGENAYLIERFRDGKAEHNDDTLREVLGPKYQADLSYLTAIGFLEKAGPTYKIPMLYRGGLNITQGKAFSAESARPADGESSDIE
ncbi:P-loop ATPase, Sll1717 family [Micromonospora humida]|uniref:P-loop ATPase, Sll1717 family n=1 Tax=Micromonospora humida TaxID=2809018 RepID=UPI0033E8B85B